MNKNVLITGATALIISSLVSLTILLKKRFKLWKSSPHYLLAISDIFSSIMIAIVLLLNKFESVKFNPPHQVAEDLELRNIMKLLEQGNETIKIDKVINDNIDCNYKTILMHYAIFLVPFANAFISLLSVSIQCNFDVGCVEEKCGEVVDYSKSDLEENKLMDNFWKKKKKKRRVLTGFSVASQWVIPILLTGILNLAGLEKSDDVIRSNEVSCMFTVNFPFENCYSFDQDVINMTQPTTIDKNYIEELFIQEETTEVNPDVDQVVSKIYEIVGSAMNASNLPMEKSTSFYEPDKLSTVVEFMNTGPTEEGQKKDVKLFDELMKNSTIYYSTTESLLATELTRQISSPSSTTPMISFNNSQQIYADIVKRIHGASIKIKVKDKNKYQKKRSEKYVNLKDNLNKSSICMENQCFISTNFLRIHLFFLLILIYLMPIFLSTLLNMRAKYICSNIIEKLASHMESSTVKINKPETSNWFSGQQQQNESKNNKLLTINEEVEGVNKLSSTFTTSLILAIILWTPVFIEILMKVFLCLDPPDLITNILYLTAISFGIFRNALNLRIIKIQETIYETCKHRNSIHPTTSTS